MIAGLLLLSGVVAGVVATMAREARLHRSFPPAGHGICNLVAPTRTELDATTTDGN